MKPLYSVVIPAYNAEATIGDALESVVRQTVEPAAIFVVDDGSTDRTAEAVRSVCAATKLLRKHNGGPGSATTAGFREVTSEYVATLDADDIWLPHKMERQLEHMEKYPEQSAVFALAKVFADGEVPDPGSDGQVVRLWTRTTMVYRTAAARAIGEMVDFPGRVGESIDWLARGRDMGHKHFMVDEVLAMRRKRAGSLTDTSNSLRAKGYLHALHREISRRKGANQRS